MTNPSPGDMPSRPDRTRQKVVGDLIHTVPTSWDRKSLKKDDAGKDVVESEKVWHQQLRYPLAQNVSAESVERLAKRWL